MPFGIRGYASDVGSDQPSLLDQGGTTSFERA